LVREGRVGRLGRGEAEAEEEDSSSSSPSVQESVE
jgi:hypothetical protein